MGAVMYSGPGLEQSPYSHLLSPANWQETADLFLRDACALLGLSMESPLTVAVTAGCKALPAHLNNKRVMQQRQVATRRLCQAETALFIIFRCSLFGIPRISFPLRSSWAATAATTLWSQTRLLIWPGARQCSSAAVGKLITVESPSARPNPGNPHRSQAGPAGLLLHNVLAGPLHSTYTHHFN